jgi:hypothetical protein
MRLWETPMRPSPSQQAECGPTAAEGYQPVFVPGRATGPCCDAVGLACVISDQRIGLFEQTESSMRAMRMSRPSRLGVYSGQITNARLRAPNAPAPYWQC